MKDVQIIVSLLGTSLGLFITVLTYIVKSKRNIKGKRKAESLLEVCNIIMPFITQAEKFTNYTGVEKKEYVLTKATQYALENGMKLNQNEINNKIEELVDFTKQVNSTPKLKGWL